jgi:hypothetical protein
VRTSLLTHNCILSRLSLSKSSLLSKLDIYPSIIAFQSSDAPRAQRGASRQLKLIFHSVPIHPRLQGGAFSAHTGKTTKPFPQNILPKAPSIEKGFASYMLTNPFLLLTVLCHLIDGIDIYMLFNIYRSGTYLSACCNANCLCPRLKACEGRRYHNIGNEAFRILHTRRDNYVDVLN